MRKVFILASLICLARCNVGGEQLSDETTGSAQPVGAPVTADPNAVSNPNSGTTPPPVVNPNNQPGNPNAPNNGASDPNAVTCPGLGTWDPNNVAFEAQVFQLVNQARALGADCNTAGVFPATTPLAIDPALVCLARGYSKEMFVDNFFSHTDPNGKSPFDRMTAAGIQWSNAGENIAEGYATPQDVVTGWLNSDGHCANIMGNYTLTGIGFYQELWTQDFITP